MTTKQKALLLALSTTVISGFSVFFSSLATKVITNSNILTTAKNILVALVLSLFVSSPLIFKKLKELGKKDWLNLVLVGFIGGSIPFLLFFKGLSLTSPVNAGFIHKTLFIWVTFLAIPLLKEKITKIQWFALTILLVGNYFLVGGKTWTFHSADFLILAATFLWAIEFIIAKKLLANLNPIIVSWGRMFFGAIFLTLYLLLTQQAGGLLSLSSTQWLWLVISAAFLLGYVITWYQALQKLPASLVTSVLVIASPITTALNSIFVSHKYTWQQGLSSVLLLIAAFVFAYVFNRLHKTAPATA